MSTHPAAKLAPVEAKAPQAKESRPTIAKKSKPEKLVKDSFQFPRSELAQLKALRTRLSGEGVKCTKSGLLRTALAALLKLDTAAAAALAKDYAKTPKGKGKGKK